MQENKFVQTWDLYILSSICDETSYPATASSWIPPSDTSGHFSYDKCLFVAYSNTSDIPVDMHAKLKSKYLNMNMVKL